MIGSAKSNKKRVSPKQFLLPPQRFCLVWGQLPPGNLIFGSPLPIKISSELQVSNQCCSCCSLKVERCIMWCWTCCSATCWQCSTFVHQQMLNRASFALRNKLCCMLVWIAYTWGSFLKTFGRIYWIPHLFRLLISTEDIVHVTKENHPTSLLFLLFSLFFCSLVHYIVLHQQCLLHKVHLRYRILIVE